MLQTIFSTPIYVVHSPDYLNEARNAFDAFEIEQYYQPEVYGVAGFTTYFDQQANEKAKTLIPSLLHFIEQKSTAYLQDVGYSLDGYSTQVANIWLSRMKENSNHNFHTHTKLGEKLVMLCGTYYVNISDDASSLTFSRSEGEFFNQLNLPAQKDNEFNRKFFHHKPKNGDLVLFLAETFHGVLSNRSKSNRDAISFNVLISRS
jgi:uncharacterized protein (TIGR02466 family)